MIKYIDINGKRFSYEEVELFHGRKKINRDIAAENLKIFYNIIKSAGFNYGLIFGTLLGAIRENNFIEQDEDTDIFVLKEDKNKFVELLPVFKKSGLETVRYGNNLLSMMRKNEYIDIYFFEEKNYWFKKIRTFDNKYNIKASFLNKPVGYSFLGMNILIPNNPEKVLEKFYGKNWRIPKPEGFAQPNSFKSLFSKIKMQLIRKLRICFKI